MEYPFMMKICGYFSTSTLTAGLASAVSGSFFIYSAWLGLSCATLEMVFGVLFLASLLYFDRRVWFWSGFFTGVLWFWWIAMSFRYYGMSWAMPFVIVAVGAVYGALFWSLAWLAELSAGVLERYFSRFSFCNRSVYSGILKACAVLLMS